MVASDGAETGGTMSQKKPRSRTKPARASEAKPAPAGSQASEGKKATQASEDDAQSPFARTMDQWRAFYGKGGPGECLVQAVLMIGPFGTIVPAKSLPEARTARARLMEEVRGMAEFAIEAYRPGPEKKIGQPLVYMVDMLAEGIAAIEAEKKGAAPRSVEYQVELCKVYGGICGRMEYVTKWEKRIRAAWHEHDVCVRKFGAADKPADDAKFMHGLLADALDVVGLHRPESNDWIKGLPKKDGARISVVGDFLVERCCWDATANTAKATLHAAYVQWLKAAKTAHPERYDEAEELTLDAFAREMNLSQAVQNTRPETKGEARPRTWKGIRLLPPTSEPAGDVAIRWESEFAETLRHSLAVPPK